MTMKLQELATALGVRLENGADLDIQGVASIEEAGPGQITFVANAKYAKAAQTTRASAIIVSEDFPLLQKPLLRSSNVYLTFARAVELFYQPPRYAPGIHPTAVIHPTARIGRNASISPYVTVDADVQIGDDCVLLPHVTIYRAARIGNRFFAHSHAVVREHCRIGDDVILQNGAVIGADGFGFAKTPEGGWYKIVQSGIAVLEDGAEVLGATRVSRGAKIDNLVQVGHGSTVGENTLLCAQVGLAGSTDVGRNVILAGQVGVAGHCKVGDGVTATAQSGIPSDVEAGKIVSGTPAIENKQWLRCAAVFSKLPALAQTLRELASKK
jgi:UDP-3-O-[3-hydroxymyristoyl] glucosamine N-acyltransferase